MEDQTSAASILGNAIAGAADAHPSIVRSPDALRPGRRAAVVATAGAMADARDAREAVDARPAGVVAAQIVDDAALSLDLQDERAAPVELARTPAHRHGELADLLSDMPLAAAAGIDEPVALARAEEALQRILLVRSEELGLHDPDSLVRAAIARAVRAAVERRIRLGDLDDPDLFRLVEDSLDAVKAA